MSGTTNINVNTPRQRRGMGFFGKALMITGAGWLTWEAIQLARKSSAADEVILDLTSFQWSLAKSLSGVKLNVPLGVKFTIGFVATNPSAVELKFTEPFIRIYTTGADGSKKLIGHSTPSGKIITLSKVNSAPIESSVVISFLSVASVLPDLLPYLWGRTNGEPSKRKLIVEWEYRAPVNNLPTDGFLIKDSKEVNL